MGLGDDTKSVIPKIGLLSPARGTGAVSARYFVPWACHPAMAVTGSQCLASCVLTPGTVAHGTAKKVSGSPANVHIEHPVGEIEMTVDMKEGKEGVEVRSAGHIRTARLLARGEVMVASTLLWVHAAGAANPLRVRSVPPALWRRR